MKLSEILQNLHQKMYTNVKAKETVAEAFWALVKYFAS